MGNIINRIRANEYTKKLFLDNNFSELFKIIKDMSLIEDISIIRETDMIGGQVKCSLTMINSNNYMIYTFNGVSSKKIDAWREIFSKILDIKISAKPLIVEGTPIYNEWSTYVKGNSHLSKEDILKQIVERGYSISEETLNKLIK